MAGKGSKGTCNLCNAVFSGSAMARHLKSCLKKNAGTGETGKETSSAGTLFHLAVEGYGLWEEKYWMHLKVPDSMSFKTLDNFLRKTWLECCGHLSAFRVGRMNVGMSRKLGDILEPRMKLLYEYDFGSTTELLITVAGELEGTAKRGKVEILARNEVPRIKCVDCDKPATLICPECVYDDAGWLCDDCAEHHDCGLDFMLPVLNSPRTGVCGYDG